MKKIAIFMLTAVMLMSTASCGIKISFGDDSSSKAEESSSEASSVEESSSEVSSIEESSSEMESVVESSSVADSQVAEPTSGDVKDAVEGKSTSDENPAKMNQWVKTAIYSATDKVYHTIYTRVTKVTTQSKDSAYIDDAIKLNNDLSTYRKIDVSKIKVPSDAELCVMEYEVMVPSDYPKNDWGITKPDISYSTANIGGGGIPSADGTTTYIGMGSMTSLETEKDAKYDVGNTYKFRELYIMVKGYENYVFKFSEIPAGTKSDDISGKNSDVFIACK